MDIALQKLIQRILSSKMRLLSAHGFFGILLTHLRFAIDNEIETAATDGVRVFFNPDFVGTLSDSELDFVIMHEVMHLALEHLGRYQNRNRVAFNIACDIVVNSNIILEMGMPRGEGLGGIMHLAPNGKEGHLFTAEQVYDMLMQNKQVGSDKLVDSRQNKGGSYELVDSHDRWTDNKELAEEWQHRLKAAAMAAERQGNPNGLSIIAQRILEQSQPSQLDWRQLLRSFVQEEVADYSFTPPDRRYEGDFFLPDFNETIERVQNLLFMIDTSASMNDKTVSMVYFEVISAIEQFEGRMQGKLGYFQSDITAPIDFESVEDVLKNKPKGSGGTSFEGIFDYANSCDQPPSCIIILTDGGAPFPPEYVSPSPVLWLLTDKKSLPTWGKVARIE